MIDVVLLLIIFFMLTAQFAKSDQTGVNLPSQRGQAGEEAKGATMIVDIDKDGNALLLGSVVTMDGVINAAKLANPAGAKSPTRIVLRADKDCPASALQVLCAGLASVGIKAIALATESDGAVGAGAAGNVDGTGAEKN